MKKYLSIALILVVVGCRNTTPGVITNASEAKGGEMTFKDTLYFNTMSPARLDSVAQVLGYRKVDTMYQEGEWIKIAAYRGTQLKVKDSFRGKLEDLVDGVTINTRTGMKVKDPKDKTIDSLKMVIDLLAKNCGFILTGKLITGDQILIDTTDYKIPLADDCLDCPSIPSYRMDTIFVIGHDSVKWTPYYKPKKKK